MTNKYQEALDILEYINNFFKEHRLISFGAYPYETIKQALQAGAEGRILPKLPEGYYIDQISNGGTATDSSWWSVTIRSLKHFKLTYRSRLGNTPAEAMQNAIDKIGGGE